MCLRNFMNNFQQTLARTLWKPPKSVGVVSMIIRGKVMHIVQLSDIGRKVEYEKQISLNPTEVGRSRDLQDAIRKGWVEVVDQDIKRVAVVDGNVLKTVSEKTTEVDITEIAKKMARTMAEEMINNSPILREMAKEIAKEMVIGIKDNLKIEQTVVQQAPEKKIDLKSSDNIFVEFKDEEVAMTSNIQNMGKVEVQKDDLTDSLEKLKKFKQNQKAKP
jgi:hypothetical protein